MEDLSTVSAAILAGGFGTRLSSVVKDRPKVLADIREKPFLAYLLDQLQGYGVYLVVLCTGYMGELVKDRFGDQYGRIRLLYSHELSPLGTAGALRLALPLFESESVLILNGDSFCGANLNTFWEWHCAHNAAASILLIESPDPARYGRVHLDHDGHVTRFDEKGAEIAPGLINAGIYLLKLQLIQSIPTDRPVSLEREIFPAWIGKGLHGYRASARFIDIGTPEYYLYGEHFFSSQKPA